jgi:hypothetical protein
MLATMSWSMSWCHYSAAEGEACGDEGLLRSWRAATSVASAATVIGDVTAVPVERWRCGACVAATTVMVSVRPPTRRDRPALGREVASPSAPNSQREG